MIAPGCNRNVREFICPFKIILSPFPHFYVTNFFIHIFVSTFVHMIDQMNLRTLWSHLVTIKTYVNSSGQSSKLVLVLLSMHSLNYPSTVTINSFSIDQMNLRTRSSYSGGIQLYCCSQNVHTLICLITQEIYCPSCICTCYTLETQEISGKFPLNQWEISHKTFCSIDQINPRTYIMIDHIFCNRNVRKFICLYHFGINQQWSPISPTIYLHKCIVHFCPYRSDKFTYIMITCHFSQNVREFICLIFSN